MALTAANRPDSNDSRKVPTHELVYRRMREMVLFGELAPGQPVTIQGLADRLGAGMTPVREALRRLISEGALEFQGNRRVSVPVLTLAQLDELAFARQTIEPRLAYLAAERMQSGDIDHLEQVDARLNRAIERGDVAGYLECNHRFHEDLYALAGADILASLAGMLLLRVGPSLRVVCGRFGTYGLPDRHRDALAAMRKGDAAGVAEAIRADVGQGIEQVRNSLTSGQI